MRSREGYWRISANSIVQLALPNRWLRDKGFPTCEPNGLLFTTGSKLVSSRKSPERTRTPGGVGAGS